MLFISTISPYVLLLLPLIFYLWPYIQNRSLRSVPGPPLARFSNLWLLYHTRRGRRYLAVDAAHKKYGPLVRIQPDHVSVADPDAIPVVYSSTGGGWIKRYAQWPPFPPLQRAMTSTNFFQPLLRCLRLHISRPLQHPQPSGLYPQAQSPLPHFQR